MGTIKKYDTGTILGDGLEYIQHMRLENGKAIAIFECKCGKQFKARTNGVLRLNTRSCGCKKKGGHNKTHGDSNTRLYSIWTTMKRRCYDSSLMNTYDYKVNEIQVCEEWKNSYQTFKDWSIENGYSDSLTIDRIDSLGNYEPSNCRWADRYIQACNTKRLSKQNTSGYRGASWSKQKNKWQAKITVKGKRKYLGTYDNKKDAAMAYDKYIVDNDLPHTTNGLVPKKGC